jgi:hypothetical protein
MANWCGELACRELGCGLDHSARVGRVDYFRVSHHLGIVAKASGKATPDVQAKAAGT